MNPEYTSRPGAPGPGTWKGAAALVRPAILRLTPYSCARDEFKGRQANVFLDANENPYNSPLNRYPDPLQEQLKLRLAPLKGVAPSEVFLGNGSDEAIDLVYRIFCEPREDNVVAIAPTYGMYAVAAAVNDVDYRPVPLRPDFTLDADRLLQAADSHTKVVWLCSPNNPTGNALERRAVERILEEFPGIVVVDEAYADFASGRPFRLDLRRFPNLIVLNTFSKLWASAAIRLGMAFASEEIIAFFNKVKYPYNVSLPAQEQALRVLDDQPRIGHWRGIILNERAHLLPAVAELPVCTAVYPTDANFFLARMTDADSIYRYLVDRGIVVRNRSRVELCHQCLRITVGTPEENNALLGALRQYKP